jgi:16S rRNA (guanine527-N7)-methyltransferase
MINRAHRCEREPRLSLEERLIRDAATLGVPLSPEAAVRLLALTAELALWNKTHNLTAITAPEAMLTHHLLDSLAIQGDLAGARIADAGTGAGFPGLPLALVNPEREFTLIDSNNKKIRFVTHALALLGLSNVTPVHARSEALRPRQPFDTVVARALAPLPRLLPFVAPLCGRHTRVLAMKGRWPEAELKELPKSWQLVSSRELQVPGLDAARCVLVLQKR